MAEVCKTASETATFSPDSSFLGIKRPLKVWEIATGNPVVDLSRQQTTCSCVQWGRGRHLQLSSPPPPKRRKRHSDRETIITQDMFTVGTVNGTIMLYNIPQGNHTVLEKGHAGRITDVCWHPDGVTVYSSSSDGYVVEWDTKSAQIRKKWKASNDGVHSMCLISQSHLLTAGQDIKKWDLKTYQVIQTFNGHSTAVFKLIPIVVPSTNDSESDPNGVCCSYFLSAAENDKLINAWYCHPDSTEKHAVTSFSVPTEPVDVTMKVLADQNLMVAVLTKEGSVFVYEHTLNGKIKKPLKAKLRVCATSKGKAPVPILAAMPREDKEPGLLIMHGSYQHPKFETLAVKHSKPTLEVVVDSPENTVSPDIMQEPTIAEKLKAIEDRSVVPSSSKKARRQKAGDLMSLLTRGIEHQDANLLSCVLQEQQDDKIRNVLKELPQRFIDPFIDILFEGLQGRPAKSGLTVKWIKQIILSHKSYLVSVPCMMDKLEKMQQVIKSKADQLPERQVVQGKLQLLLSRIATQCSDEEEAKNSGETAMMYQDYSSDEDEDMEIHTPMEFGASESEDNWGDWD